MRIVMLSKALVVGAYQRKLEELACLPGVELTAIVPAAWDDERRGRAVLERVFTTGYDLQVAPLAFNGRYHYHFYPTLGRLLRGLRPDVLHVDEEPYNLATWHALRAGGALGAAGLFFTWQNLSRRYPPPFCWFESANYRRAAYALAGNQAAVAVLRAKGYHGPVKVVPQFGVDPELFRPEQSAAQAGHASCPGAVDRPFVIGYMGALLPEKGVDLLLRACAGLPFADWQLQIVGDGPERTRLEALAHQLDMTGRVRFWGRQPSTDSPAVLRTFDLLVLPSLTRPNWMEQFGRVLVEAMASAVPVVGSSSGEIPRVIGDAGIVCPEGDEIALRTAIAQLARDPARRADLARRGRERVLRNFTQAQVARETYDVYRELFSARRQPDYPSETSLL